MQSEGLVRPVSVENFPAEQPVHEATPVSEENRPAGHSEHFFCPFLLLYCPLSHFKHDAVSLAYVPIGQVLALYRHCVALPVLYVPTEHFEQLS